MRIFKQRSGLARACSAANISLLIALVATLVLQSAGLAEAASYRISSCSSCHASPPLDGSFRDGTTGAFRGSHQGQAHKSIASGTEACPACHVSNVTFAHRDGLINMNTTGLAGYSGAFYDKNNNGSYDGAPLDSDFSQNSAPVLGKCRALFCHSNVQPEGGLGSPAAYNTPVWAGSVVCGDCHAASPATGSHPLHLAPGYPAFACSQCHKGQGTGSASHTNNSIGMGFMNDPNYGSDTGLYNGSDAAPGDLRPGQGYGTCTTVYCHSNAKTNTPEEKYKSPKWGGTPVGGCTLCHAYPPDYKTGGGAASTANSHLSHKMHTQYGTITCDRCHKETTANGSALRSDLTPARHVNRVANVVFDSTNPSGLYSPASKTCSDVSCHVVRSETETWGLMACADCHGKHASHGGKGTTQSHATHVETDSHGVRGPAIACGACHDTSDYPYFKSGTDNNSDGRYDLSETDVCNTCHSPGGSYDGVNNTALGAKALWDAGVYVGNNLASGKEKWCATCHDEAASLITGVAAQKVIGNETEAYAYGTGYGFYKTGHGLSSSSKYPSSGITNGAGLECSACHDYSLGHVDGVSRSFGNIAGCSSDEYRLRYRLSIVNGTNPMRVPLTSTSPLVSFTYYELCLKCHNSGPFLSSSNMGTNLKANPSTTNRHYYHLSQFINRFNSDWSGGCASRITCITCHNVHGSTRLAMVRDSKLINPTNTDPLKAGIRIWYYNSTMVTYSGTNPPVPDNLPLALSNGTVWSAGSSTNICTHCHANNNLVAWPRNIYQDPTSAPTLEWTGESGYVTDGASPDTGFANSPFEFRVTYKDINNNAPSAMEVWLDLDDSGSYTVGEKFSMQECLSSDTTYYDGKIYKLKLSPGKAGDMVLDYRFHASDATGAATGAPIANKTITLTNYPPVLAWTGANGYESDGVTPDSAAAGRDFVFRVKYTDANNEAPGDKKLWVAGIYNGAMDEADLGDTVYTDGKVYTKTLQLSTAATYDYRFLFTDGADSATGAATATKQVLVTSGGNLPLLDWTGESGYATNGLEPDVDAEQRKFTFRVKYTDMDNDQPTVMQVWVDQNNSAAYESGEKYNLTEADASDTDYSNGKLYGLTMPLSFVGSGATGATVYINHAFQATGGGQSATGAPTSNVQVGIINGLVVPTEYATLQAAITAAQSGQTVVAKDGVATSAGVTFPARAITVKSVSGPAYAMINASGSGRGVDIPSSSASTIEGFTITRAGTVGIFSNGSPIKVKNCIVERSVADGGIQVNSAVTLTVEDSIIRYNTETANYGAGIYMTGAGTLILKDSTVAFNNSTNASWGYGGGIYINTGGTLKVYGSVIENNTAQMNGGGVYQTAGSIAIFNSTIRGNLATTGGGLHANSSGTVYIANTVVSGNTATGATGAGGLYKESGGSITLNNVLISGNRASSATGYAGGLYAKGTTTITNTTIAGNASNSGGGIYCSSTSIVPAIKSSILWGNDSAGSSSDQIQNCGTASISYSDIDQNNFEGVNYNVRLNPEFVNAVSYTSAPTSSGDYHIQYDSGALDRGSCSASAGTDIDLQARPQGSACDMGADEYLY